MTLHSNPERTAERYAELEQYMRTNVTSGAGGFCCVNGPTCRASALVPPKVAFYEGQLSHVGKHYDMTDDGHDLRILVLGMETGRDRENVTMGERRAEQMPVVAQEPRSRKPHMKGTASALRLAFGGTPGPDKAGDQLDVQNRDEAVHVFEAYALANVRLCSAVVRGSTQSKGTLEMTQRCSGHLEATVRILEPTLVISQSARTRNAIESVLSDVEPVGEHLEWITMAGVRLLLASFVHPYQQGRNAHLGWGGSFSTPYLDTVVAPTIAAARALLLGQGLSGEGTRQQAPSPMLPNIVDPGVSRDSERTTKDDAAESRRRKVALRVKRTLSSARKSRALDQAQVVGTHVMKAAAARAPKVIDLLLEAVVKGQRTDGEPTVSQGGAPRRKPLAGPWTIEDRTYADRSKANRALARALVTYTDEEWATAQRRHGLR